MKKIKPLQKKHRFIKWLKKLFGIKSHYLREWKDIDEMHLHEVDKIYEKTMNNVIIRRRNDSE